MWWCLVLNELTWRLVAACTAASCGSKAIAQRHRAVVLCRKLS